MNIYNIVTNHLDHIINVTLEHSYNLKRILLDEKYRKRFTNENLININNKSHDKSRTNKSNRDKSNITPLLLRQFNRQKVDKRADYLEATSNLNIQFTNYIKNLSVFSLEEIMYIIENLSSIFDENIKCTEIPVYVTVNNNLYKLKYNTFYYLDKDLTNNELQVYMYI